MKKIFVKYPLLIFILSLILLFIIIFIGNKLRKPKINTLKQKNTIKTVKIFDTSQKLLAPITGKVNRMDTLVLRATRNGIVTKALKAGDKVSRGEEIIKLSDTYNGSSVAEATAALAQRNAKFQDETSDTQQDILKTQKKDLRLTKDRQARIAWKQYFIQERSVELAHDMAKLQANQALANAELFKTIAPFSGELEELAVNIGDYVQAGEVLAVLKTNQTNDIFITSYIGAERASHIDIETDITAEYKNKTIPLKILHLSQSSTGGESYTLTFIVDKNDKSNLIDINDQTFIKINLPLKSEEHILVPLDSVHFSSNSTEIYTVKDTDSNSSIANLKTITLGEVIGSYATVIDGLDKNAKIIMDRNITAGEKIIIDN